jgi:hypothetical protein
MGHKIDLPGNEAAGGRGSSLWGNLQTVEWDRRQPAVGRQRPAQPGRCGRRWSCRCAAAQRQAPPRNAATKATQECIAGFGAFSTQAAVATASCS